ncbi:ABC transporter, ATP-binding protein [Gleimia coleocanis DSM 15436]|uniref:ABC transporter, ATP-binding protein n=1 Tax=Gleimia coleocanis DSM 15436 TaxID=525245 RepID=C0W0X3_9ACTO|nr:ABC transporter ATP-binding protein [Gleimia coleocanis]EEH63697.1 ABC transporter, ATP-binding protein [Gleimia coleocanis DSM 15436]
MKLPLTTSAQGWNKAWKLTKTHRSTFYLAFALEITAVIFSVAIPWVVGKLLDLITTGTTLQTVYLFLGGLLTLVILSAVVTYFGEYYATVFSEKIFGNIRANLIDDYLKVPLSTLESAGSGDIIARGTHDLNSVRYMLHMGASTFVVSTLQVIFIYTAIFVTSWQLGLIVLAFLPVYALMVKWYLDRAVPAYRIEASNSAKLDAHYVEVLDQAVTVEAFSLQNAEKHSYLHDLNGTLASDRYTSLLRSWLFRYSYWLALMPLLLVILVGVYLVGEGWLSVGAVTAVSLYILQLRTPLDRMSWLVDVAQVTTVALRRIFGVGLAVPEDVTTEVTVESETAEDAGNSSQLSVANVSFEYRPGKPVLRSVSLDIKPGETLAIVGPSGAGKSTLGRLLAGINSPTVGEVTLNGVPLTQIPEAILRNEVVLVTQEHHVFLGTLRENLTLACADATDTQIHEALQAVGATQWVTALENGLDTKLGAGEYELSAPQAQQLSLARIILLNPHTLVLDEATSLIDPTVARNLERSMRSVLAGRTVISIAHRLYTSHDADRIAVMIDGQITELGSHTELVEQDGEYASLWHTWQHQ